MTRRQDLLAQALDAVGALKNQREEREEDRKAYGRVCHALPALILRNGLCEAVAFLAAKGAVPSADARAYALVQTHLAAVLGCRAENLQQHVSHAPLEEYMRSTRAALQAWTFYKRLAVSLLGVRAGEDGDDGEGNG